MFPPLLMNLLAIVILLYQAGASSGAGTVSNNFNGIKTFKGTWLTLNQILARSPRPKVIYSGEKELSWPLCQVQVGNETIPGWLPNAKGCSYGLGGEELKSSEYKYLVLLANKTFVYLPRNDTAFCEALVEGGADPEGEPYLVCSIRLTVPETGEVTSLSGKVRPGRDGVCLIPWLGKEVEYKEYDILCIQLKA